MVSLSRRDAETDASRSRGIALVLVVGILGLLVMLAVAFTVMQRAERRVARGAVDRVRAGLLARSGVEFALARLAQRPEPIPRSQWTAANRYDDWSYRAGSGVSLGEVDGTDGPSYGMSWPLRGTNEKGTDTFRLRIDSANARLNVNAGDLVYPGLLRPHPVTGDPESNPANVPVGRMLDHLGGYLGVSDAVNAGTPQATSSLGARILGGRPVGGYTSLEQLRLGVEPDWDLVRDFLTLDAWAPAMPASMWLQSKSSGMDRLGFKNNIAFTPQPPPPRWPYEYHRRSPVPVNLAPIEVLRAVLRDVASTVEVIRPSGGTPPTSAETYDEGTLSLPGWYWLLTWRVDAATAADIAAAIDARRATDPFESWRELLEFFSANKASWWPDDPGITAEENQRDQNLFVDMLMANFDPNNRLAEPYRWRTFQSREVFRETTPVGLDATTPTQMSKINLGAPGRWPEMGDPNADEPSESGHTTEFTLGVPPYYDIESLGVLADAVGSVLASASIQTGVRPGGTVMATTQEDFENFDGPALLPDGTIRTGTPVDRENSGVQSYPEFDVYSFVAGADFEKRFSRYAGELRPRLDRLLTGGAVICLPGHEDRHLESPAADATGIEDNYGDQASGYIPLPPPPSRVDWSNTFHGITPDGPPGGVGPEGMIWGSEMWRFKWGAGEANDGDFPLVDSATGRLARGTVEFRGQLTGGGDFVSSQSVPPNREVQYTLLVPNLSVDVIAGEGEYLTVYYNDPSGMPIYVSALMPPDMDLLAPFGRKGWYHAAVTFDDEGAGTLTFYVNGQAIWNDSYDPGTVSFSTNTLQLRNTSRIRIHPDPLDQLGVSARNDEDVYAKGFHEYESPLYVPPDPIRSGSAHWTAHVPVIIAGANPLSVELLLYPDAGGSGAPTVVPVPAGGPAYLGRFPIAARSWRFRVRFDTSGIARAPFDDPPVFEDFVFHYDGGTGLSTTWEESSRPGERVVWFPPGNPPPPASW